MDRSWTFTAEVVPPGDYQKSKFEFVSVKEKGSGFLSTFKIAVEQNKNPEEQFTKWVDPIITVEEPKNSFDLTTSIPYEPTGIQKPSKTKKTEVRTRALTIAELLN